MLRRLAQACVPAAACLVLCQALVLALAGQAPAQTFSQLLVGSRGGGFVQLQTGRRAARPRRREQGRRRETTANTEPRP